MEWRWMMVILFDEMYCHLIGYDNHVGLWWYLAFSLWRCVLANQTFFSLLSRSTHQFLTGKVIRSCSGCKQGYVDHRYYNSYRLRLLLILPFHLALSAVYMAIVGAVAVLTCGFGCCFGCGTRGWFCEPLQEQHQSSTPSSSSRFGRMKPATGVWMTTRLICMPLFELIADCGFHGVARDDERSQPRKGNDWGWKVFRFGNLYDQHPWVLKRAAFVIATWILNWLDKSAEGIEL